MSKFYAVKKGKNIGIFNTWSECKENVNKFPGAEYKSFTNEKLALQYLNDTEKEIKETNKKIIQLWTDGSATLNKKAGYGYVIIDENEKILDEDYGKVEAPYTAPHSELEACYRGVESLKNMFDDFENISITIYSDSMFLVKSLTIWGNNRTKEEWKQKDYYDTLYPLYKWVTKNNIKVEHVAAHTGIKWNEYVDKLAEKGKN